ncbi:hypothetical protein [Scleromatobacter humisilvae]|uniref:Uncharacterized protein n=1 Tax=Scleromatobacter humisilvae TaxID=2897159 RepID=A0A9X2C2J6_9BURK|nr:hypothetical protein [Scleromatobacter humisilvae]MCK9688726.1 hypothetical protein [Scleromatobacter humisilvae]
MRPNASNNTAAVTGIGATTAGYLLGPLADRHDASGSVCLCVLVLMIAVPAYYFVFGVKKEDMEGNWMFEPSLIKRIALFLAGAIAMAFVLSLAHLLP